MQSQDKTIKESLFWFGPYLGAIGGISLAAAYGLHPTSASPETVAGTAWLWIHVGFMVSLLAGVFLLTMLMTRYLETAGQWSGVLGYALAVTSLVFVFGLDYSEVFIFPTLALEFPEVVTRYGDGTSMPSVAFAFPASGIMFVLGFVLFAWQLAKTGVISATAANMTIIGTIAFGIGLSGMLPMLVVRVGAVLFGAALIWLGYGIRSPR